MPLLSEVLFAFEPCRYEPEDLKDTRITCWESLLHPDDVASAYIDLKAHLDGLTDVFQHEQRLRCKDGSYR